MRKQESIKVELLNAMTLEELERACLSSGIRVIVNDGKVVDIQ